MKQEIIKLAKFEIEQILEDWAKAKFGERFRLVDLTTEMGYEEYGPDIVCEVVLEEERNGETV